MDSVEDLDDVEMPQVRRVAFKRYETHFGRHKNVYYRLRSNFTHWKSLLLFFTFQVIFSAFQMKFRNGTL